MTGVCAVPLFSPTQFTVAPCQFRYATYTHASIYCMYMEVDVDLDFSSSCEPGTCTAFYNHNLSYLFFYVTFTSLCHTHMHIFTHTAVCTSPSTQRKKAVASSLAYLRVKLRTLCSVCRSLMYSLPLPPQPATHINTSASIFHSALSCHSALSQTRASFKSVGLFS